jgi:hypothetical protein
MLLRGILVCTFTLFGIAALAQSVISAHSGLIHFFEGNVAIDGQPVSPIHGRFPEIPEGSRLAASDGQAEILLGPESFLWLGRNSALRMERNILTDTHIEFLKGSAMVQSLGLPADGSIVMIFHSSQIRLSASGLYRIDAEPPQLTVLKGRAKVTDDHENFVVTEAKRLVFSSLQIFPAPKSEPDGLERWALERRGAIATANRDRVQAEAGLPAAKTGAHRRSRPFPTVMVPIPRRTW